MDTMIQEVTVLQPQGNLDSTQLQEFKQQISHILNDNHTKIVLVDFQNVTFMDSSGLGALVLAFKALKSENRRLVLCSINEKVRILLELTSMDKVFEIFPSQEEFNQVVLSNP